MPGRIPRLKRGVSTREPEGCEHGHDPERLRTHLAKTVLRRCPTPDTSDTIRRRTKNSSLLEATSEDE